jgi:galactose mutarotase-like enzyme
MLVHWSREDRLGEHGDSCDWPLANGEDLSIVGPPSSRTADKLFSGRLKRGWCSLYHPKADESISFRFDPQKIPYIGLWMTIGGWQKPGEPGHFTVALEPCNGRPDSLEEAYARGECAELKPKEVQTWWLRLQVKQGPSSLLASS